MLDLEEGGCVARSAARGLTRHPTFSWPRPKTPRVIIGMTDTWLGSWVLDRQRPPLGRGHDGEVVRATLLGRGAQQEEAGGREEGGGASGARAGDEGDRDGGRGRGAALGEAAAKLYLPRRAEDFEREWRVLEALRLYPALSRRCARLVGASAAGVGGHDGPVVLTELVAGGRSIEDLVRVERERQAELKKRGAQAGNGGAGERAWEARAGRWAAQLREFLAAAEAVGLVHGDLKAKNVLVDEESDDIVIIDFGWSWLPHLDPALQRGGRPPPQHRSDAEEVALIVDFQLAGNLHAHDTAWFVRELKRIRDGGSRSGAAWYDDVQERLVDEGLVEREWDIDMEEGFGKILEAVMATFDHDADEFEEWLDS